VLREDDLFDLQNLDREGREMRVLGIVTNNLERNKTYLVTIHGMKVSI